MKNRNEYPDYIMQKANDYIGHPPEVDEGYEVAMRRSAYAEGYITAIEDVISKCSSNIINRRAVDNAEKRISEISLLNYGISAVADYDRGLIRGFNDATRMIIEHLRQQFINNTNI